MKRFLKVALSLVLLLSPVSLADTNAQTVVFDAQAFVNDMIHYYDQAMQWIEDNKNAAENLFRVDELTEKFNKWFGDESTWATMMKAGRNVKLLAYLTTTVNNSTQAYASILTYARDHFSEFDPSLSARLMRSTRGYLDTVMNCFETAKEIIQDMTGKAENKQEAVTAAVQTAQESMNAMIKEALGIVTEAQSTKSALGALMVMDGASDADYRQLLKSVGRSNSLLGTSIKALYGVEPENDPELAPVAEGSVSVEDVLGNSEAGNLKNGMRNAFKLLTIVLGLMLAGMLTTVLVKYIKGDSRDDSANNGFFRIFIAAVVVIFVLTILSGYIGFGL